MTYPNVFIIGEPKCGTTALAEMLSQHPDVCVPHEKEPNYFCTDFHEESDRFHGSKLFFPFRSEEAYLKLFDGSKKVVIDASTNYAYSKVAAQKIHAFNPDAKIIYMVRDPVKLVASLHAQYVKEGTEEITSLAEALRLEKERKQGQHLPSRCRAPSFVYYLDRIKFDEHYQRFVSLFPYMLVLTQKELHKQPEETFKKIETYIGLSHLDYTIKDYNERRTVSNQKLNLFLRNPKLARLANRIFSPAIRKTLKQVVVKATTKPSNPEPIDETTKSFIQEIAQPHLTAFKTLVNKNRGEISKGERRT